MPSSVAVRLVCAFAFATSAYAGDEMVRLGSMRFTLPADWEVVQTAQSDTTQILGLQKTGESITLLRTPGSLKLADMVTSDATVVEKAASSTHASLDWQRMVFSKAPPKGKKTFVAAFLVEALGATYRGFSRAASAATAKANATALLDTVELVVHVSLTDSSYTGKKFYLGWGAALAFDSENMHNVAKYDVKHTMDVFAAEMGGNYLAKKLIGTSEASETNIRDAWEKIGKQMKSDDMFLQYSTGHGGFFKLAVGVTYDDIADAALSFPAKEVVIFTMACHSGGVVDSFNSKKSKWKDWLKKGRSLLVMSSSELSENSGNGPDTDPDEPGGPEGSGGSAFGHALWKAIIGKADGYIDGVKDGFISLGEIKEYVTVRTYELAAHTPQTTGTFYPDVIMTRVPPPSVVAKYRASDKLPVGLY